MPSVNLSNVDLQRIGAAGALRHRVTFAQRDTVEDAYGNMTESWIDRFTVWANIIPKHGGEQVMAERLAGRQPVVIRVRASPDTGQITTDWRATDENGREYNLRTALDPLYGNGRAGFWYEMLAETGVAV